MRLRDGRIGEWWTDRLRVHAAYGAVAIGVLLGLVAYLSRFEDVYIDDAFIQLQYARTLVAHFTWGFFPDRPVNTATSPLSVMVAALFGFVFRSTFDAVTWLTAVELSLLLLSLLSISRRLFGNYYFGLFAFTAFATNPLLLSTIGLDSILYTLLVVASVAVFLHHRWSALGALLGLLTLTRPEGVLLLGIYLVLLPAAVVGRVRLALAYAATVLPWYLFSWRYLGSFIPDTLVLKKTSQAAWGRTYSSGLQMYWERYPHATFVTFFLLPAALCAVWWWWLRPCKRDLRFVVAIVGTYGLAHFLAYSLLAVPPYHWYYTHQVIPTVLIGSLGLADVLRRYSLLSGRRSAALYLTALTPIAGLCYLGQLNGFPFTEPPIHTNWAAQRRYEEAALWLKEHVDPAAVIETNAEIGTLAFYSERYLRNEYSDMNIATAWMERDGYRERHRTGWIFRLNYYWRREQPPLPAPAYFLDMVPFDDGRQGGDIVHSWAISSTWIPQGRLYLHRVSGGYGPRPDASGLADPAEAQHRPRRDRAGYDEASISTGTDGVHAGNSAYGASRSPTRSAAERAPTRGCFSILEEFVCSLQYVKVWP